MLLILTWIQTIASVLTMLFAIKVAWFTAIPKAFKRWWVRHQLETDPEFCSYVHKTLQELDVL